MALNIKNQEAERLAAEVAALTGESKTGAVRRALRELHARLLLEAGGGRRSKGWLARLLETEFWPLVPEEELDRAPLTRAEREGR
jgi:antitoxin VapB